jgi:hypothetical protein
MHDMHTLNSARGWRPACLSLGLSSLRCAASIVSLGVVLITRTQLPIYIMMGVYLLLSRLSD